MSSQIMGLQNRPVVFENFPKHRRITGILEPFIPCVNDESEKCAKKRKAESFGGLLGSLGEVTQERQDLLRGKGFRFPITKLDRKFDEKV
jgi:hypothetical protein